MWRSGCNRDIQRVSRKIKPAKPDLHLSYFFFAKMVKSLGAIRLLWASAYFQDALVLSRCVFEAFVLDMYIRTNRAALTDRYLAYDAVARHSMSVGIVKSLKNRRDRVWLGWKAAGRYGRAVKNLPYDFGDTRGWSGKSFREIVRAVENRTRAEGLWTVYEFFYGPGASIGHSSPQSMQEYMRRPHRTSYQQNGKRRAYLRDLPMLVCRWCLITCFLSAQEHFRLDEEFVPSDALVEAYHLFRSLIRALGEDLRDFDSKFFS
jgi:Family of unknown function (DUF5677)